MIDNDDDDDFNIHVVCKNIERCFVAKVSCVPPSVPCVTAQTA